MEQNLDMEIIDILVKAKVDINAKNTKGKTALDLATVDMVKEHLKKCGAKPGKK